MTRRQLSNQVRANWPAIVSRARVRSEALEALPAGPLRILGSSTKVELGEAIGILTAIVYLAPADASGRNLCPSATAACRAGCLGVRAGRMVMAHVRAAQLWKTALRFGAPDLYFAILRLDIAEHAARAESLGMIAAVRLDGTSDLGDAIKLAGEFPDVAFYDYSKRVSHAKRALDGAALNYRVTLSFSGENRAECVAYLRAGGTVAVPFDAAKGDSLPSHWEGFPTLDGDASDARFLDAPGHVVALSWKGPKTTRAAAVAAGWAQPVA